MTESAISIAAFAFAAMGIIAIAAPTRVTRQFDVPELSAAGRNEVRAVYGGFGLAVAGILVAALLLPGVRAGICLTVASALSGTAAGRLISAGIDGTIGRFPLTYLAIEAAGAALLFYAV